MLRIVDLQLNNATNSADIEDLATELVSEVGNGLQVLVLVTQCLTGS